MTKKKRNIIAALIGIFAVSILSVAAFVSVPDPCMVSRSITTEVKDGECDPKSTEFTVFVPKSKEYVIGLDWWQEEEPGFITGALIKDENGKLLGAVSGNMLNAEMESMYLEEGNLNITLFFMTTEDELSSFIDNYIRIRGEQVTVDSSKFTPVDGKYTMDYKITLDSSVNTYKSIGLVAGVLVGLCIVAIVLSGTKDGDNPDTVYDERQLVNRGDAYKISFCVMIALLTIDVIIEAMEIKLPMDEAMKALICMFTGIIVNIVICIKKDAYMALNENKRKLYIAFFIIGLLNLAFGILQIVKNGLVKDGIVKGFNCVNLLCALLFVIVGVSLFIKEHSESENEDDVDFDDESDSADC